MSALDYQNHPGNPDYDPSKDLHWTPKHLGKDVTIPDLRSMMIDALQKDGWTPNQIAGYVTAQESHGLLRPDSRPWMRNAAALYYLIPLQPVVGVRGNGRRYQISNGGF